MNTTQNQFSLSCGASSRPFPPGNASRSLCLAVLGLFLSLQSVVWAGQPGPAAAGSYIVYVGTFPSPRARASIRSGSTQRLGKALSKVATLAAEAPKPGVLALHPNCRFLYSANETDTYDRKNTGSISAFAILEGGRLELLNTRSSGGPGLAYVSVDASGRCALVAHYNGGCVSTLPIGSDGRKLSTSSVTLIQHKLARVWSLISRLCPLDSDGMRRTDSRWSATSGWTGCSVTGPTWRPLRSRPTIRLFPQPCARARGRDTWRFIPTGAGPM